MELIDYYISFDDHIKKINEKIKENEDFISSTKKEIEELKEEIISIQKQKEEFSTDNFKPSITFISEDKELEKRVNDKIKEHELKYHPEVAHTYFEFDNNARNCRNYKPIHYEFYRDLFSSHDRIRCLNCFKEEKGYKVWSLDLQTEVGSSN